MKLDKMVLLIIDDDPSDLLLIEKAFRQNGVTDKILLVDSGDKALAYLKGEGKYAERSFFPYPSLVITDLKMPGKDGFSILEQVKGNAQWRTTPVVVLSGSDDPDDIKRSYAMGASCYIKKPSVFAELRRVFKLFYDFWKECHFPEVDVTGKQLDTEHIGKLGERFGPVK
jgi:CheY-like chemotaxis protein